MSLSNKTLLALASAAVLSAIAQIPANAEEISTEVADSGWTFEYTQNGWLTGIKGSAALFGAPPVNVDVDFSDLVGAVDWGNFPSLVMSMAEARNGQWGVNGELIHLALAVDGTRPGPPRFSADLELQASIATAMVNYRLAEEGESYLDVMAGGRFWWVDGDLSLALGRLTGAARDNENWVDPMVGLKGRYDLGNKYYLQGWGMIGGFGVGSDTSWDVFGGVGYQFNEKFSASIGWRHLEVDYSKGAFAFDVAIDGPMLQASYKF